MVDLAMIYQSMIFKIRTNYYAGVFQVVMAGLIALENEFRLIPAILVVPLIPFTIWYSKYYILLSSC